MTPQWENVSPPPEERPDDLEPGDEFVSNPLCIPSRVPGQKEELVLVESCDVWLKAEPPVLVASTMIHRNATAGEHLLFQEMSPVNGLLTSTIDLVFKS